MSEEQIITASWPHVNEQEKVKDISTDCFGFFWVEQADHKLWHLAHNYPGKGQEEGQDSED